MVRIPTADNPVEVIEGDCLDVLRGLPAECVDAVITDPPYSSGGLFRGDRAADPSAKYEQTGTVNRRVTFGGDNRDQRSFAYWCQLWLSECLRVVRPGGYLMTFTDWRQLPVTTDAVQAGGWVWRGILSWDKGPTARAAYPHYFRHQCEYVVWATAGVGQPSPNWPPVGKGCYPGSYSVPVVPSEKEHLTGKPVGLLRQLVFPVPPGGLILDPFAGSGTTGVAAAMEGRRAILIEQDAHYAEVSRRRVAEVTTGGVSSLTAGLSFETPDMFAGVPA